MTDKSLSEVHGSVEISRSSGFLRRLFAFSGPAYLVSIGYMDPGNWATGIAAGSRYGYALVWVLLMSNALAVLLQGLCTRLGLVSGLDLAQACRGRYPPVVNYALWILCEIAISACDLAEVIGSAIGLELLFGIPLAWGVILTALDTFLILFLHQTGIRKMEAFILVLIGTIGACFLGEVIISKPNFSGIIRGFLPTLPDSNALYFAIGILGATVMPHNLYLHSALVQSRRVHKTASGIHQSLKYNLIDSIVALNMAFLVNAAILVMAAAVFYRAGYFNVAEIQEAHALLAPIVGASFAPAFFAIALICSGQASTITGTLAGQIVMEGFINIRLRPWVRRIITRMIAIIPAVLTIIFFGENSTGKLLVLSQVVLSLQLSFAVIPLIHMVSDKNLMGAFSIRGWLKLLAWFSAFVIVALNVTLVVNTISSWISLPGTAGIWVRWGAVPLASAIGILLVYVLVEPFFWKTGKKIFDVHREPEAVAVSPSVPYQNVAAALDFGSMDHEVLSRAAAMATISSKSLFLFHVAESAGALALGKEIEDAETNMDFARLNRYALELGKHDVDVKVDLGFGDPVMALANLVEKNGVDLLVVGAHGHKGIEDLLHGATIDKLRHQLKISVLVVGRE